MAGLLLGETFTDPTGNGQPDKLKLSNSEGRGARPSRISQLLPWIGTLGSFLLNTLPGMVAAKPPINVKTGLGTCLVGRLVQLPVQCNGLLDRKGLLTRSIRKARCWRLHNNHHDIMLMVNDHWPLVIYEGHGQWPSDPHNILGFDRIYHTSYQDMINSLSLQ